MIVKGDYEALSMAIYGVTVVPPSKDEDKDSVPVSAHYEPKQLHIAEPSSLSKAIDPANSSRPTQLAEQLLSMASEGVDLPFAARLIYCLKPPDEHWDDPDFPHLYADLENTDDDFDLESVVSSVKSRPVQDTAPKEAYTTLANRVNDFIGPAVRLAHAELRMKLTRRRIPIKHTTLRSCLVYARRSTQTWRVH